MCRNYLDSRVPLRDGLFTRSLNATVRRIDGEKSKKAAPEKIAVKRVSLPGKFLQSYGDQGKVRVFWDTAYIYFRVSAAGCRDTTHLITDKVFFTEVSNEILQYRNGTRIGRHDFAFRGR